MCGLIVCATQRSGSTLLCELLKATGVAGNPNEYFQRFRDTGLPDQPRQYLAAVSDPSVLELLPAWDPGTPEIDFDFDAVRRAGSCLALRGRHRFARDLQWTELDVWRYVESERLEVPSRLVAAIS